MNPVEAGRARVEEMERLRARARADGERRFEGFQVLSGITLSDEDKERYLIGFVDGWLWHRGVHADKSALQ